MANGHKLMSNGPITPITARLQFDVFPFRMGLMAGPGRRQQIISTRAELTTCPNMVADAAGSSFEGFMLATFGAN